MSLKRLLIQGAKALVVLMLILIPVPGAARLVEKLFPRRAQITMVKRRE